MIDDLPAFVLLISMVRSRPILVLPSSHSPPVPFLSYCPLPPALSKLTFSTLNSPPFSPLPHSYAFISFPKSPRSSHPLPHVSSFKYNNIEWVHIKTSTFLEARTGYCCIHRVKQTIVHMIHMILSRSVHQITYGDVIKAFCKKTSLQRTPPSNGHYCSSQWCPLFGGFTVLPAWTVLKSTISHIQSFQCWQSTVILPLCHKLLPILPAYCLWKRGEEKQASLLI